MAQFLETVINGKYLESNLHNTRTLVYCALPDNLPLLASPSSNIFLLSLAGDRLKMVAWALTGSYSHFRGISQQCRRYAVVKLLLVFHLLLCLLLHQDLSQESRRVEGELFSSIPQKFLTPLSSFHPNFLSFRHFPFSPL